ncbi:monovalent cation:proton antiporter-2 (CPA2) family protein [Pseudomonas sp. Irchel 3A18]|uniref:monovalent cation:proton antiporter-2 (CPA2) family protein n=1 Tax=Pseudomonas sp. Irchel 3A18 TaxID=2008905 RepID=UPI000BA3CD8F|nr:monovalent cation:proton antiporter-2 (CPA2) family protein [Pseudomonas sp. Irchel 3A18]
MTVDALFHAFLYLCAGVLAVPVAKRLGLGSVLGYLIAGIIIGPLLGLVGAEAERLQHFAEFGVVMMLFLVGLELQPQQLWDMRHRLLGLGGLQVLLTTLAVWGTAVAMGVEWKTALAIGLIATASSTAIALQTLDEKRLLDSDGGRASFSVLLFQDISVIPMLALLPLLVVPGLLTGSEAEVAHGSSTTLLTGLPGWMIGLVTLLAVASVVVGGHYLTRPLFRFIATAQMREIFTASALLLVVGTALLMSLVGLSPALGTFLAGVVLANSEYRHELESDIGPFKGLLLGLFFITVGASIDFALLFEHLGLVVGLTLLLIVIKALVLWVIGSLFRLRGMDRWLLALGLAQSGEFAFVLLSFSVGGGVLAQDMAELLLLVVALSMLCAPLLFVFLERVILPRQAKKQAREADAIDDEGVVIIAGCGRFGQIVNRLLHANGYSTVVLDISAEVVETLARFDVKTFFGDASRPDLLEAAGLMKARLLVVAIDDRARALTIVRYAKRVRPDLHVVARAYDRLHVYDLFKAGCDEIIRETFDSAVRAGRNSLEALGMEPGEAQKTADAFVKGDRHALWMLAQLYDPQIPPAENPPYVAMVKQVHQEEAEQMMGRRRASNEAPL